MRELMEIFSNFGDSYITLFNQLMVHGVTITDYINGAMQITVDLIFSYLGLMMDKPGVAITTIWLSKETNKVLSHFIIFRKIRENNKKEVEKTLKSFKNFFKEVKELIDEGYTKSLGFFRYCHIRAILKNLRK